MDGFTIFSFNGKCSSDFNIIRVSNGNRYEVDLVPSPKDNTLSMTGMDGLYYIDSTTQQRNFSIQIAYDNLTEKKLNELKQWLSPKTVGELIFGESPYKKYEAKIETAPKLQYICFVENENRIYKGEGTIQFVVYNVYATNNFSSIEALSKEKDKLNEEKNYHYLIEPINEWNNPEKLPEKDPDYNLELINKEDAGNESAIQYFSYNLINYGDLPMDWSIDISKVRDLQSGNYFKIELYKKDDLSETSLHKYCFYKITDNDFIIDNDIKIFNIYLNTKTRELKTNGTRVLYAGDFFKIPADDIVNNLTRNKYSLHLSFLNSNGESVGSWDNTNDAKIAFNYLYY